MLDRRAIVALALAGALTLPVAGAQAFDESKYPDFSGQWRRPPGVGISWDQTKPLGLGQQAPLTPEYQKILEASLADQAAGGQGRDWPARCMPFGLPRIMTVVFPMEIVITPNTTHMLFDYAMPRRIYTDGRPFPTDYVEPTFYGLSIGKWVDEDGDGKYDVLEIETRNFKSPRSYEASGLPLHDDGESVVNERLFIDKADNDILHDVITVIDHALTRPWTIDKHYKREHGDPVWYQLNCSEDNRHVYLGNEHYFVSGDDKLMPSKKNQEPPDLRYFKTTKK
jgi:hypothetical protein